MAKIITFFALCLFSSVGIYAQTTVSGTVTDSDGEPLIGATIIVRGTSTGTVTDIDGQYNVSVKTGNAVLTVSYLGYITEEIAVQGRSVINVTLKDKSNTLDDLVVIGYGTARKRDLSGSVASLKAEQLLSVPVNSPAEALQGRIAGLDVTKGPGPTGSGVTIRLRGNRSITTSKGDLGSYNGPLIIVDGMQGVSLDDIPPNDILTIDVLKDAASTAIYGARGANGVIIVTTKAGQTGRPRLSINSYYGISEVAKYGKYTNTEQWIAFRIEQERGKTANAGNGWLGDPVSRDDVLTPEQKALIDAGNNTYYPEIMLHTGFMQEHTFSVNAGNEDTKIYLSGTLLDEQGVLKRDGYTSYTGRMNIDQKVYKWLDVGMRMQMAYRKDSRRHDPMNVSRRILPFYPYKDDDGNLLVQVSDQPNPLLDDDPANWQNDIYGTRFSGAAYAEIKPLKGLSLRSNFGVTLSNTANGTYFSELSIRAQTNNTYANVPGTLQTRSDSRGFQQEHILTYKHTFADIHNVTFTGLASTDQSSNSGLSYTQGAPAVPTQLWFDPSRTLFDPNNNNHSLSGEYRERSYVSFAARAGYILMDKYVLNATIRRDASSKVNSNWASFPSVGAAWRISDEKFISESSFNHILSNLKLRATWGISGNDRTVSDYMGQTELISSLFSWDGTTQILAYQPGSMIGNKDLTWEATSSLNLGLDLGLFKNRANISVDLYKANTNGLIAKLALPPTAGASETYQNVGEMENKGLEILLETQNIAQKDFRWNTTVTFAANKEKVVSLPGGVDYIQSEGTPISRAMILVGYPIEIAYGFDKLGIWQIDEAEEAANYGAKPGDLKLRDISGSDGVPDYQLTEKDLMVLGKLAPDWYGAISNDILWKGFDLNVLMTFRYNFWISSENYWERYEPNAPANRPVPIVDYWTPENSTGTFPRPGSGALSSLMIHTMGLTNNSFLKIRNITLGYTLPQKITQRITVNRCRLWASAKNAFVWQTDKQGFDPESINNLGQLITNQPLSRLITFGVNIEF